jgi:predicted GNAT superfamily acetyltransferase
MSLPNTMNAASNRETTEPMPQLAIRPLSSEKEYVACVDLQRLTWGEAYEEVVTGSLMKVAQRVGGLAIGAFSEDGTLLGFVFGLTGVESGRLTHWSHMLAVHPRHRDRGIGRRLKEHQRELLVGLGVEAVLWTFDPLVARNAHLNLNRLGVRVVEYVADMYPGTGSVLHTFGTDRFVVTWPVAAALRSSGAEVRVHRDGHRAPVVNRGPNDRGRSVESDDIGTVSRSSMVRIRIPSDIESIQADDLRLARAWRASTRAAFQRYVDAGYVVSGFSVDDGAGYYLLTR